MDTPRLTEKPNRSVTRIAFRDEDVVDAVQRVEYPIAIVQERTTHRRGVVVLSDPFEFPEEIETVCTLPELRPENLGDPGFLRAHGVRYPYIAGEMATGIATSDMVIAMARAAMLGFFGAGGLPPTAIQTGIDRIRDQLDDPQLPWGVNLIHNLQDPEAENKVTELLLRNEVRRVCASAYLQLTPAVVRYACSGLHVSVDGKIIRPNHLFAKISRPEIARRFAAPPPSAILSALVDRGHLTSREAELATHIPLAQDMTVEADSGGHTDNRPLVALFPTIVAAIRDTQTQHRQALSIRVGAAGGLGTPHAVAAAFSLGAAYVVTGSVNQAAIESGLSQAGRDMLNQASIEDVAMAPAADMFELGVKVQVLKRGTMFSVRAQRLYDIYRKYASIQDIPDLERQKLEGELFRAPLDEIWRQTHAFFMQRNPQEVERAKRDPKHLMALVFRWYLGQASRWAMQGVADRVLDYQIWCGPAMGAFNAWTQGSFLADFRQRTVVQIARNLLQGAAVTTRAQQLRTLGLHITPEAFNFRPRQMS